MPSPAIEASQVAAMPSPATEASEPPQPPNIVWVNLDDTGIAPASLYERLPMIKSLFLEHGVSFVNAWNNFPLCCPGRASQLTGQWAHHTGVIKNDGRLFNPGVTLATELHDQGYYTFITGKYLNGTSLLSDKTPPGWDDVAIADSKYYRYTIYVNDEARYHGSRTDDYSTDVFAAHSLEFLATAPADKPIFAFLNPYAVHQGADQNGSKVGTLPAPAPRHKGDPACQGVPSSKLANYNEADVSDKPYYIRRQPLRAATGWPLQRICETLLSVDEWTAGVVDTLKAQGRFDNTIFILTTDNGRAWGSNRWIKKTAPYAAQIPLFIYWPATMVGNGSENDMLLANVDLAPTLCELAGCVMGPFANGRPVDGQSFAGLLAPDAFSSVPTRDATIHEHLGPASQVPRWKGIMTASNHQLGRWFYVHYFETGEQELYDMSGGPCLHWEVGDGGDPCMMSNKAHKAKFKSIRWALRRQMEAMW